MKIFTILFAVGFLSIANGEKLKDVKCKKDYRYRNVLVFGSDASFEVDQNATQFREQFLSAGFTRADIIQEGKNVAQDFLDKYGMDATNLPDPTYLAPNVKLGKGVTFTFGTVDPAIDYNLIMASHKGRSRFINAHSRTIWYSFIFNKDFVSKGSYAGVIPAGSVVYSGNFLVKTCKRSILCCRNLFIKFTCEPSRMVEPGSMLPIKCDAYHEKMGHGSMRGLFTSYPETGLVEGNEIILFP